MKNPVISICILGMFLVFLICLITIKLINDQLSNFNMAIKTCNGDTSCINAISDMYTKTKVYTLRIGGKNE